MHICTTEYSSMQLCIQQVLSIYLSIIHAVVLNTCYVALTEINENKTSERVICRASELTEGLQIKGDEAVDLSPFSSSLYWGIITAYYLRSCQ